MSRALVLIIMRLLSCFLRFFFYLLYHPFVQFYDLVAWTVSLGRWKAWVESALPFITGNRILELGHGPGHLQRTLRALGLLTVGLDESRQMGSLAKRNLSKNGYAQSDLIRGLGQDLPFQTGAFHTVVATFPTEYIFDTQTLSEIWRVLKDGGRLIVIPAAWVTGTGLLDKAAAWLFRITGQTPSDLSQEATRQMMEPFIQANFQLQAEQVEVKSSLVLIVIAEKKRNNVKKTS